MGLFEHSSKTGAIIRGDDSHSFRAASSAATSADDSSSLSRALGSPNSSIRSRTSRKRCSEDPSSLSIRAKSSAAFRSESLQASAAMRKDDSPHTFGNRARNRTYKVAQPRAPWFLFGKRSRLDRFWEQEYAFSDRLPVARRGEITMSSCHSSNSSRRTSRLTRQTS